MENPNIKEKIEEMQTALHSREASQQNITLGK